MQTGFNSPMFYAIYGECLSYQSSPMTLLTKGLVINYYSLCYDLPPSQIHPLHYSLFHSPQTILVMSLPWQIPFSSLTPWPTE